MAMEAWTAVEAKGKEAVAKAEEMAEEQVAEE